jgi:hypothetical protein
MDTPQPFLRNGKMMDFSRLSQSGVTCAVLTVDRGAALLTWFREDFLVRTSRSRAQVRGLAARDQACGANSSGLFARFDPDSHMWRTAQRSLLGDSHEFLLTLPRSGLMRSGALLARTIKVPGTNASGSGLLPTLTVHGNNNRKGISANAGDGLATLARRLPPIEDGPIRREDLAGLLPTLVKSDSDSWSNRTPEERIAKGHIVRLPNMIGGPLNPEWCEWFMGWPIGWTGLQPLETGRFQSWLNAHGRG